MTHLCLENYGVTKLETQEMKATNGGNPYLIALAISLAADFLYEVANDWEGNVQAFKEGYSSVSN